ncbi:MAG TPA: hypothetical protein VN018_06880 [Brevundimonas sp.]|nr:hypothetical protein [Brevundimonas sp.]
MFGRHGAVMEPVEEDALARGAPLPMASPEVDLIARPAVSQPGATLSAISGEPAAPAASIASSIACERSADHIQSGADDTPKAMEASSDPGNPVYADDDALTAQPQRALSTPGRRAAASTIREQVGLEAENAMDAVVSVAGAALEPDEAERFRSRAEQLLLEHGLSLRTITFHGGPTPAPVTLARIDRPWP